MTWFKVDDKLHSHKKAAKAGTHAMGLWALAGSWCADQLTDGFIPDYMAEKIDRDYEALAARLVAAGLWVPAERDGDKGWQFHDWNDEGRQPTREQVLAERAANAERQKRARERAKEKRESRQQSEDDSADCNGVTNGVTNGHVTGLVTVPPTRPVPSVVPTELLLPAPQAAPTKREGRRARGTRIPDDFAVTSEMVAWATEKTPHVDGRRETEKFINYWTAKAGRDATKLDWVKTWQNWMLTAEERTPGYAAGHNDQGRAGADLTRRPVVSAADQRVADGEILYAKYAALDAAEAEAAARAGAR